MKQILVGLCAVIMMSLLSLIAQEKGPSIAFDNTTAEFDKVTDGEQINHVFKFVNKGGSTLDIVEIQNPCGCISTLLTSRRIEPGQSGQIDVKVSTADLTTSSRSLSQAISIIKTVSVFTNDRKQPTVILVVKAKIVPEFALSDSSINFGTHFIGEEISKDVLVEIPPDRPIKLISAASTDNNVMARLEPVSDSGEKKIKVIATLKATAREGQLLGSILVRTSSALKPELKIPILGIVTKSK